MLFRKKSEPFAGRESWLLVGLGNPGRQYERTRHNCGYMALNLLAQKLGVRINKARFKGAYAQADFEGRRLILLKPETYMNLSGESVRAALDYFKISRDHLLVFYDDIDLPLGRLRLRGGGGAGTHNGMRSLLQHLGGDDFSRLRIGIGPQPPERELASFVLEALPREQETVLNDVLERAAEGTFCLLREGLEAAMRRVNGV